MRKVVMMLMAVLPLAGCGSAGGPARVSVTGTITHEGKPLEGASVSFVPMDPKGETPGMATTTPDGTYALIFGDRSGVAPGPYKVVIAKEVVDEKGLAALPEEIREDPLMASRALEAQQTQKTARKGRTTTTAKKSKRIEGEFNAEVPPAGGVLDFDVKPAMAKANAMGR